MISLLEGNIEFKGERFIVINAGGVGYKVYLVPETIRSTADIGNTVRVWTHLAVREDALDLFGFVHYAELQFFELLISIPAIGPRSALNILGVAPLDTLKKAIASGETAYLTSVSGIGRKLAEKIVLELKDKIGAMGTAEALGATLREEAEAIEALTSMGYSMKEARDALTQVDPAISGMQKRLQEALKLLGRSRR